MLTFALFRSPSLAAFWNLLGGLVAFNAPPPEISFFGWLHWVLLALIAVAVYLLPNAYDLLRRYRPGIIVFANASTSPEALRLAWRPNLYWAILLGLIAGAVFMRINHVTPFLYGAF